ncbi:cation:proton antiporter [Marvinbryantia formatexigens]|nr:cation:proton antiporter [Marvinbryantia formatexigens]UWO26438.1 cation:proton antiporter [Marvinbryantia formatexigens DSM 14469]SDF80983.1 transporter, CPA2 family [Marvinbryantia formatexigens]
MEQLFALSVCLLAGLLMSRVVKKLKLPAVTAYLVGGILIGPYCLGRLGIRGLGFVSNENVVEYKIISEVALGFIAFSIGNEFRLSQLKKTGRQATVVAFFEALTATFLVTIVMILLHMVLGDKLSLPAALLLGAIATATAPAATLMVVRQYKAKGSLTDILLPIVALDDAIALAAFAIFSGIAGAINMGHFDLASVLLAPILEIIFSLALGAALGAVLTFCEKFFYSNSKRLSICLTFVLLAVAISMLELNIGGMTVGFSSLLVCMMLGTVFCNMCNFSEELMSKTDQWTAPVFILFFVLSGAELEFSVFTDVAIVGVGIVYVLVRSLGKYIGASAGSKLMKCDDKIVKYLGITLLPQAGVALGMSLAATETMGEQGILVRNITLFAVLIYELVGPMFTKIALTKAGEISVKPEVVKRVNTGRERHER